VSEASGHAAERPLWEETPPGGEWADRSVLGLSHLERAQLARQGRLPISPMTYLTELAYDEASSGHAEFSMPASPWFANGAGLIPGGMLAPVADAALGASVGSQLGPGILFTTAELSLTFIRPLRPQEGARMIASGQSIHVGRSIGVSEAFILAEPGSGLREAVVAACQRAGFSPIPLFEISDPLTVRHLVQAGLGVGVAPAAWFESPGPTVAASPLAGEALRHRVGALTAAGGHPPAAELLLAALRDAFERPVEL